MPIKKKSNQYIGLHLVDTYITDTDPNSEYFRISAIPEIFPGGKTAFRIDGSSLLKVNSEVKVEVLNAEGNVIYSEYPDYIEGSSRLISVYVYSDEIYGEAIITVMGEAVDVPPEWKDHLNVRWQKRVIVDPALRNLSAIKFYKPPVISAQELYTPYMTRTYTTSSSPEWVTVSGSVSGQMVGSDYMLAISGGVFIRQMEGGILNVPIPNVISGDNDTYQTSIKEVINANSAIAKESYQPPDTDNIYTKVTFQEEVFAIDNKSNTKNFSNSDYTVRYEIEPTYSVTENFKSFAKVNIVDMETFSGDIYALKLYMKSVGSDRDYNLMGDVVLESPDLMIDENTVNYNVHYGLIYNEDIISSFWTSSRFDASIAVPSMSRDSSKIRDALFISGSQTARAKDSFYTIYPVQDINLNKGSEYTFEARLIGIQKPKIIENDLTGSDGVFQVYMSGSAFNDSEANVVPGLGKLVGEVDLVRVKGNEKNFGLIQAAFIADRTGNGRVQFVIPSGDWYISQMTIKPSQETGFSPDNAIFIIPINDWQRDDKLEFKAEFYDFEGKRADTFATSSEFYFKGSNIYIEGTDNVLTGSVYIGNAIGDGIEMAGVNSAYLRNVDYRGWSQAIDSGSSGFMIWSGSVLNDIAPGAYGGVGLEIHGGLLVPPESDRPHALRFRTDTGRLEITGSIYATDGYFSGSIEANRILVPLGGISPDPHAYYDPDSGNYYRAAITQIGYAHFMSGSIGGWQIRPDGKLMAPGSTFMLSGSGIISASHFYVDELGNLTASNAKISGHIIADTGSIGGWLIGTTFLSASNILIDSNGTLQTSDFVSGQQGWRITSDNNGYGEFENVRIRGTLRTTVFEKESVNAVGGQLWVANSTILSGSETASATPGNPTYATWSVENASGWATGEVVKIKKVTDTGFTTEYVAIASSSRLDPTSGVDFRGNLYVTRSWNSGDAWYFGQLADPSGDSIIGDSGSGAYSYEPGQVIVSTGISQSGYIRLNANPRDPYTPYIDIVERTGSGVYDLELKARLGDLSGLSPSLLYGDTSPGHGLYTENVYLTGKITATTGSFTGVVHVGDFKIGQNVNGPVSGVFLDESNYWYDDGLFRVGDTGSQYIDWDGSELNIFGNLNVNYFPVLPTDDHLVGHWTFDEGYGNINRDNEIFNQSPVFKDLYAMERYSGSFLGTFADDFSGSGVVGNSFKFANQGAKRALLVMPHDSPISSSLEQTYTFWFKPYGDITVVERLIDRGYLDRFWGVLFAESVSGAWVSANLAIGARSSTGTLTNQTIDDCVHKDLWHFIMWSIDYTTSDHRIIIYNERDGKTHDVTLNRPGASPDPTPFKHPVLLGGDPTSVGGSYFLDYGLFDEVRFYNTLLSDKQIEALYLNPAGTRNTVLDGGQIVAGKLKSINWDNDKTGSLIDLDDGRFMFGGSGSNAKLYFDGNDMSMAGNYSSSATITGGVFQTAAADKRIIIDGSDNTIKFYEAGAAEYSLWIDDTIWGGHAGMKFQDPTEGAIDSLFMTCNRILMYTRKSIPAIDVQATVSGSTYQRGIRSNLYDTSPDRIGTRRIAIEGRSVIYDSANTARPIGIWGVAHTPGTGSSIGGFFESNDIALRLGTYAYGEDEKCDFKVDTNGYLSILPYGLQLTVSGAINVEDGTIGIGITPTGSQDITIHEGTNAIPRTHIHLQNNGGISNGTACEIAFKNSTNVDDNELWGGGIVRIERQSNWGDWKFYSSGGGTPALRLLIEGNTGNVGIGTTTWTGGHKLYVFGSIGASGTITPSTPSDIRFKKNISQLKDPLQKIIQIRGVEFDWADNIPQDIPFEGHDVGFIADEVEKVFPEAVIEMGTEEKYKGIRYDRLIPLLVEAIKEQNKRIDKLEKQIKDFENDSFK